VVNAGALSVMVGLNTWDDRPMVFQKYLLTDVLKKELGFKGFLVSDWYGVYEGRRNIFLATVSAVNAGVDMVMLPFDYKTFIRNMKWANRLGLISDERIDEAVGRILYAKFALGLFDADKIVKTPSITSEDEHRALAREAVAQSLVLLKNNEKVLPIKPSVRHIRVAGSVADNVGQQAGAWTVEWQGIDGNWLPESTSILKGIRDVAPSETQIEFSQEGIFSSEQIADIGIAVVGEKPYAEGWGDTEFPILSAEDRHVIQNLRETSKQLVVVTVSGRPLLIENEIEDIDALVAAWLPGSEGGGVADVLFGHKSFTGTLPLPWPLRSEQLPLRADDTTADNTPVLFQRGFGLTY
jgi:beta-glucosidase